MIRVRGNEIRTYFNKVILTTNDGVQTIYTDTPSIYQDMVGKFHHVHKCEVSSVDLTEEQQKRLKALQSLTGRLEEKSELLAQHFVEDGYLSPFDDCDGGVCQLQPMLELLSEFGNDSKTLLINKYKEKLAALRYDKECAGCVFNGMMAYTDKQAQASINATYSMFQMGAMQNTKFKFMDGWQVLNMDQMKMLAITVAQHVQICFNAEEEVANKLAIKSLKELASYVDNPYESNREGKEDSGNLSVEYEAEVARLKSVASGIQG